MTARGILRWSLIVFGGLCVAVLAHIFVEFFIDRLNLAPRRHRPNEYGSLSSIGSFSALFAMAAAAAIGHRIHASVFAAPMSAYPLTLGIAVGTFVFAIGFASVEDFIRFGSGALTFLGGLLSLVLILFAALYAGNAVKSALEVLRKARALRAAKRSSGT